MQSHCFPCIHAAFAHQHEVATTWQLAWRTESSCKVAQVLWHPPVDELHSIENKGPKISNLFLTLSLVAVKQTRSLTVSKVFPVGGESGAQTSSLRPSTDLEVISESGNGSCWRPGTAVPRCEGESLCVSFQHGGAGRKTRLAPAKATGLGERNSSGVRLSQDNRAAPAQSGAWAVRSH